MKRLVLVCCCATAALCQQSGLQGVVVDSTTGRPIAKASVHISSQTPNEAGRPYRYGALTDSDGRFAITPAAPGHYYVTAERYSFLFAPGQDGGQIKLEPGHILDYRIEMRPRAIISGRVTNDDGDPVGGVQVSPMSVSSRGWNPTAGGFAITDDRGIYRFSVSPGEYRLRAEPPSAPPEQAHEIRTDGTSPVGLPVTWFPQAPDAGTATVVTAAAGKESGGKDIHLVRARRLSVSGIVSGMVGGATPAVSFTLMLRRGNPATLAEVKPDGSFRITGLEPGIYQVSAVTDSPEMRAIAQVELSTVDVTHVLLELRAPADLHGVVEVPSNILVTDLRVRLNPTVNVGRYYTDEAQPQGDGTFIIESVPAGRYEVFLRPEVADDYIKSIRVDGREAQFNTIDLEKGAAGSVLRVLYSKNAAHVSGTVSGKSAEVWLIAEGADPFDRPDPFNNIASLFRGGATRGIHHRWPSEDGTFSFDALPPGRYRLFSMDGASPTSREEITRAIAGLELFDLHEGDHVIRDVKPIAAERSHAK